MRFTRSPQTPRAVELTYAIALKRLAVRWAARARELLLPVAKRFAKEETARTDAADGSSDGSEAYRKALNGNLETLGRAGYLYVQSPEFAQAQAAAATKAVAHSKREFSRLGIKLREAEPKLDQQIKGWRKANVDLVKTMFDKQKDILSDVLARGESYSYQSIADKIAERCNVTASRAEFLARDQTLKLNSNITTARMGAAGVTEFIWTTTGDERVRPMHAELDGETFSFDDPPVTNEDGDTNLPGEDYQCRCVPTPVLPEFDEDEDGTPANDTTADDAAPEPEDKPDEPLPIPEDFEEARIEILAPGMRPEAIAQVHAAFREVMGEVMRPETIHELIGAEDIGANQVKYYVTQYSGSVNISANIRHEDGTKSTIERVYSRDENGLQVSHDLFWLSETQRGKGLGKTVLREQVAAYDRLGGAATIETSADRDGQYVWPNMGFAMTDAKQLAKVKTEFTEYLCKTYGLETATADSIVGKAKTITDLARTNLSTMALPASAPLETGLSKADEWKAGKRFLMGRGNDRNTSLLHLQVRRGEPEEATFRRYLRL